MAEYNLFRKGKLVLRSEKTGDIKLKRKKKKTREETKKGKDEISRTSNSASYGGWTEAETLSDISGSVCIEFGNRTFVKALDNGCFIIGSPHLEGEGPLPEEILTAIILNEQKVAFKSGYGRYVACDKNGNVVGKADAIGPFEHWEPIFQDGKLALLSSNGCFMSVRPSDDHIVVTSRNACETEYVRIRFEAAVKILDSSLDIPSEERGNIAAVEKNYVRKFQKFQDKKVRINSSSRTELIKARSSGTLHETLLDRRSKMKSDRYCK